MKIEYPENYTSKFDINYASGGTYDTNKQIRLKRSILQLSLGYFSDAYIVVKETITVKKRCK